MITTSTNKTPPGGGTMNHDLNIEKDRLREYQSSSA